MKSPFRQFVSWMIAAALSIAVGGVSISAEINGATPRVASGSADGDSGESAQTISREEYLYRVYVLGERVELPRHFTGTWRTWYSHGQVRTERNYVAGVLHGVCSEWDEVGRLVSSGEYDDGEYSQGSFRSWYQMDDDAKTRCYCITTYSLRRPHGSYTHWTAEGQPLIEGNHINDRRSGTWRRWDVSGQLIAEGEYRKGQPWNGSFAIRSNKRWRIERYENGDDLVLRELKEASVAEVAAIATDRTGFDADRWRATRELGRRKDPSSVGVLIELLQDDYHSVRGSASWGLCQIGGKDAQDALLEYLRWCIEGGHRGDLASATEAQKVLPDPRAASLLIECLSKGGSYSRAYAAETLGKLGHSSASLPIAKLLDVEVDYGSSRDYLYLKAIRLTKGKDAAPVLVEYLSKLVERMKGEKLPDHAQYFSPPLGSEARQVQYSAQVYGLTIAALKSVTGEPSIQASREEVAAYWRDWLESTRVGDGAASDPDGEGSSPEHLSATDP